MELKGKYIVEIYLDGQVAGKWYYDADAEGTGRPDINGGPEAPRDGWPAGGQFTAALVEVVDDMIDKRETEREVDGVKITLVCKPLSP